MARDTLGTLPWTRKLVDMSKTWLRIAAFLSFVAGLASFPISTYFFPYARLADSSVSTDGHRYITDINAGAWVLKVGFIAALVLIVLSCVLLWLSFRSRKIDSSSKPG